MLKRIPWNVAICDWNGTLLDDLPLVYGSVQNIFRSFGKTPPSLETYQKEITADFMKFYKAHGIPVDTESETLNAIRKEYFKKNNGSITLTNGARELLSLFLGLDLKIGIVSGEARGYLQGTRLKQFGIEKYFDFVFDGISDKMEKFKEVVKILETDPKTMFYIDDSFDGVTAAKSAGITTFGFVHKGSYNSKEKIIAAKPDYIVENLLEIIPIISS
ncbi:MAG: HAD family hydrolase [Patescibacteria group bacterium]